eukprot:43911_1
MVACFLLLLSVLRLCDAQLRSNESMQCPTGFLFYNELRSCLPKCISLDDPRNATSYECLYVGNYSVPLNKRCDYSFHCRSGYCECKDGLNASTCILGQGGFIANNTGICKARSPCVGSPHIPNPRVTADKTVLFDYQTNQTKTSCSDVYSNDVCVFECIPGYIAVDGYFEVKCGLDLEYDHEAITCEQCPDGFTNNHDFTKCVQKCVSDDDERDANQTLCRYNNGQVPNGYHCTRYVDCKSGICRHNTCYISSHKQIVYEKDTKYDGTFLRVYSIILQISECVDLCISHKHSDGCTHFSYDANKFECRTATSRVYSRKTAVIGWISGYIRDKATFDIVLRHDISQDVYFTANDILECNIDQIPSTVSTFSQLKYFVEDMRYKSVNSMFEFVLNVDGSQLRWMQSWDILQNIDQIQSLAMHKKKHFTWISIDDPIFKTLDNFEGLYQTANESESLLNVLPLNAYPIGLMKPLSTSISILWLAAKIQVVEDDSWELVLQHNVTQVDSSDTNYYFDTQSVERINSDYKEQETEHILYSILNTMSHHNQYLDAQQKYHFKLLYPQSIFQHDPIYFKQSTNPFISTEIRDFESMHFLSSKFDSASHQIHNAFPTSFNGLKRINDNTSLLGTDNNDNSTFRVGQFSPYSVSYEVPMKAMGAADGTFEIQPMGGIIGPVPFITHDEPRKSLQAVSLFVRNHRKCRDWSYDCWKRSEQCETDAQVSLVCRKSCKRCNFVSRTDLYEFHLGSSTLPQVSAFIEYRKAFHRVPLIRNVWLKYLNGEGEDGDSGSNVITEYDTNDQRTQVLFMFSCVNSDEEEGWRDDVFVYWNVYEDWSPLCQYHDDDYCLSINRKGCSASFFDNSCMQCFDDFTEYSHSARSLSGCDAVYGAMECAAEMPDAIVVIADAMINENEVATLSVNRMSYYGTSALGIGAIQIFYTIQHWQTDDSDFDHETHAFSGRLTWEDGDTSARTVEILAVDDRLFELRELFWLRLMMNYADNNMTLRNDQIELAIRGPNDLYEYRGWIEILDENLTLVTNTSIRVEESDRVFTFYLKLTNSSNYCEVYYATKQDTAIEGDDYMAINQSSTWHKYDILEKKLLKQIEVRIYDDEVWEIEEKVFYLSLWKSYGVSTPINALSFVIIDNDPVPSSCNLTEWSAWSVCHVARGNEKIFRWKIHAHPDALYHLKCENMTESKYCTNWDKTAEPGIAITPVQFEIAENDTFMYNKKELSVMLQTPPNLTMDLGYDPYPMGENRIVAEISISEPNLLFYPKTVRFTVNSWHYPQTVFVTAINNEIYNVTTDENGFYYLFPQINVRSPDTQYNELDKERKSILGTLMAKVIEDESPNADAQSDGDQSNTKRSNIKWLIIGCSCTVLFCLICGFWLYRKKKRDSKAAKAKKNKAKKVKTGLYHEFDDDAILDELIGDSD